MNFITSNKSEINNIKNRYKNINNKKIVIDKSSMPQPINNISKEELHDTQINTELTFFYTDTNNNIPIDQIIKHLKYNQEFNKNSIYISNKNSNKSNSSISSNCDVSIYIPNTDNLSNYNIFKNDDSSMIQHHKYNKYNKYNKNNLTKITGNLDGTDNTTSEKKTQDNINKLVDIANFITPFYNQIINSDPPLEVSTSNNNNNISITTLTHYNNKYNRFNKHNFPKNKQINKILEYGKKLINALVNNGDLQELLDNMPNIRDTNKKKCEPIVINQPYNSTITLNKPKNIQEIIIDNTIPVENIQEIIIDNPIPVENNQEYQPIIKPNTDHISRTHHKNKYSKYVDNYYYRTPKKTEIITPNIAPINQIIIENSFQDPVSDLISPLITTPLNDVNDILPSDEVLPPSPDPLQKKNIDNENTTSTDLVSKKFYNNKYSRYSGSRQNYNRVPKEIEENKKITYNTMSDSLFDLELKLISSTFRSYDSNLKKYIKKSVFGNQDDVAIDNRNNIYKKLMLSS